MILERQHGRHLFTTEPLFIDRTDGFTAIRLFDTLNGEKAICAEIVYWDACGQFLLNTLGREVPLEIIEDFIGEAKEKIKVR